jgi:hypothetical protein
MNAVDALAASLQSAYNEGRLDGEAEMERLREAAIQYLASDGSHGLYDAAWMLPTRKTLVALVGGEAVIEAAQDRMMTFYGEPLAPAALAETPEAATPRQPLPPANPSLMGDIQKGRRR